MDSNKNKITKKFVNFILLKTILCGKLLDIIELAEEKKGIGIKISKKFEDDFDNLVEQIQKCDERQSEVEIALGIDKDSNFILN